MALCSRSAWICCLAVILIGTASCTTSTNPGPAGSAGGGNSGSGSEGQIKVAFVTNQVADFWSIAREGCLDAAKEFDVEVDVRMPPQPDVVEQKRIVEDLLTRGIDGIAISPLNADNQIQWLNEVAGKVPLITHDSDAPAADRLMYIGMDNYKAGRMCGELIKKALPDGGEVMIFIGRMEQDNSKLRRQGLVDELFDRDDRDIDYYMAQDGAFDPTTGEIKGDKYTIIDTLTDPGDQAVCQQKAEDAINTYPEMDLMAGLFEYNPPACYQALKKANKIGEIKLVGFDENDVTLQAIKDGECVGTIVQDPYEYGYQSVKYLKQIIEEGKESVADTTFVNVPPRKITQENVDEFWTDLKQKTGK